MNNKNSRTWLITLSLVASMCAAGWAQTPEKQSGTDRKQAADVSGTWSGTLYPKNSNVRPFSITIVVTRDPH